METIIGLIIIGIIWAVSSASLNNKVDNYPISKVDTSKMVSDKVMNNLSDKQVQRNMVNGKYDKRQNESLHRIHRKDQLLEEPTYSTHKFNNQLDRINAEFLR